MVVFDGVQLLTLAVICIAIVFVLLYALWLEIKKFFKKLWK
jgi:hypothetical protein